MPQEEVEIVIDAQGKVTIRTIGIKGPRCLEVAEAVARIVGREDSRTLTHEYHEQPSSVQGSVDIHQRRI